MPLHPIQAIKENRASMLLFMLVLPAFYLLLGPYDLAWALNLCLFTALALCYWQSITKPKHRKVFVVLQLLIVGVFGSLFSPWSLALAFYPALVIGMFFNEHSVRRYAGLMGLTFFLSLIVYHVLQQQAWYAYWLPVLLTILAIPFVVRMQRRTMVIHRELKTANEEITRLIKNEERQRISRDLHDSVGHTLSLITLKSELMERLIRLNPDEAIEEAKAVQGISRSVLLQIRELISDMQAVDIEEELQHAEEVFEWAKVSFQHENHISMEELSSITRNILGMCLRECTTNVLKHSGAGHCSVTLEEKGSSYVLQVEDDGKGFSTNTNDVQNFGSGIHGMKERLLLIGGTLQIDTSSAGTKITITVPKM
ncbi:sensor histidine kinase [Thalassobacillus pellis]|uniref:sensor histidine kinase n=1 Tax=Thalassobacillus pellis TaxID=748008 RepID=UPI0019600116|nr:sensor histidine kinase [Thalassobacillus pellis]MBM7554511.1 two-component system sensor histidine kinase DesK [Thalassobacillus pellis]